MSKDPAFLFYSSDFLTGTITMSSEQVGNYIRLLCMQHQKGHLSEKDMLKICSTYDEDVFSKFISDEEGKFYNKRLEFEITKRINYSESRRKNRASNKKDMSNICKSYVEHMENENENVNINSNTLELLDKNKNKIESFFETVWNAYPKKEGKGSVSKTQKEKLYKIGEEHILRCVERYKKEKAGTERQYLQMGSTFFNSGYVDYLDENYKMVQNQCDLKEISKGVFKL